MTDPVARTAIDLERALGDPGDLRAPINFRESVRLDQAELFPEDACRTLDELGMNAHYVPAQLGGRLHCYEELLAAVRVVARRDLTVAVAHGKTFLGCAPVWVAGTAEQKKMLAARVLAGAPVSLALTEREHGSDLAASEFIALERERGFELRGRKWLINNGTRCRLLSLIAATDPGRGPRATSMFLIDKEQLDERVLRPLSKVSTHGIRGADISGLELDGAHIDGDFLLGPRGHGLDVALKTLQLTRAICSGLSLGAADTALRLVLTFVTRRRLYGGLALELAPVRRELTRVFLKLLIAEATARSAARAIHFVPEEMSVWSSVSKYFVPTLIEEAIATLSRIFGARYYLREGAAHGFFEKLVRDNAIVSLFDGSTAINLESIGHQLRWLVRGERSGEKGRACFRLGMEVPETAELGAALELTSRGRNGALDGLASCIEGVRACHPPPELAGALDRLTAEWANYRPIAAEIGERCRGLRPDADLFELAQRYCRFHAAASVLGVWLESAATLQPALKDPRWLTLVLSELFPPAQGTYGSPNLELIWQNAFDCMMQRFERGEMFSLQPFQLALADEKDGWS